MKPRMLGILSVVGTMLVCLSPGAQPGGQQLGRADVALAASLSRPLSDAPWETNVKVNDDTENAYPYYPFIAVDPMGNAYVIWGDLNNGDIYFSYRPAGGSWGSDEKVNDVAGTAQHASIAVDSAGNAHAAWTDMRGGDNDIYFSYRPAGGSWGPNVKVNDDVEGADQDSPWIVTDSDGDAYLVWADGRESYFHHIFFSYRPAGGSWSPNAKVSDAAYWTGDYWPRVALDSSANAYAVWHSESAEGSDIRFSYRPAGGSWGASARVNDDPGTVCSCWPSIAVDPSGNAYAVWADDRAGDDDVYFSLRPSGGSWAPDVRVNDDAGAAFQGWPSVAVDPIGIAYVVWEDLRNGNTDIYYSYRSAGGSWSPNVRVNDDLGTRRQADPAIAVDPGGNAYAVWEDDRDFSSDIYFSYRPAGGVTPTCPAGSIPIVLVHGWHGSEQDDLANDYQMGLFAKWLEADGYREADNSLFYATGIDSTQSMLGNGLALRQTIYRAQERSGCSTFDIIGHSFGGLTARAYVESGFYAKDRLPVSMGGRGITIRQVFMLGTPNGGVAVHPVTLLFGIGAELKQNDLIGDWVSIDELLSRMPDWNKEHTQPAEVAYQLVAGTARNCAYGFGNAPCDGLALQDSVHALSAPDLRAQYPNTQTPTTPDIHGCYPEWSPIKPRAYNCPDNSTYKSEIAPYLGGSLGTDESLETAQLQLSGPSDWAGGVQTPLVTGVITTGQTITATVNIDAVGTTEFYLGWPVGNLDLSLTDAVGTGIISSTAETDPNVDFFALETDALLNYESYVISDAVTGDWVLTIDAVDTYSRGVPFAAFAIPDSELSLSVFADQDWYPKNQEAVITATLTLSVTAVTGASTEATIYRPDTISDTVTLYDDGTHNDESEDDGIYGNSYASTDVGGYYAVLAAASGNLEGSDYERGAETGFSVSPETASLIGSYSDYPEDVDGNGKHEQLVLNVGIDVGQTADFQLSAKLLDGDGELVAGASDYASLMAGVRDVLLRFDGEAIRAHGVDGPYTVTDVYLFDASGVAVKLDEAFDVWTTPAYVHDIFGNDWLIYLPLATKIY